MTAWDKMQKHQIYNDFDPDLFELRVKAKKLFKEFNRTTYSGAYPFTFQQLIKHKNSL
jgi:hypothetical protein